MSLGERIRFFRNLRGLTMKSLGMKLGFSENTADIRISQYENNNRVPRPDIHERLEEALDVSALALDTPNLDTGVQIFHTMLAMEDVCNLQPVFIDGKHSLIFSPSEKKRGYDSFLATWEYQRHRLAVGEITLEQYNKWKYHFPEIQPSSPCISDTFRSEQLKYSRQILKYRKAEEEK